MCQLQRGKRSPETAPHFTSRFTHHAIHSARSISTQTHIEYQLGSQKHTGLQPRYAPTAACCMITDQRRLVMVGLMKTAAVLKSELHLALQQSGLLCRGGLPGELGGRAQRGGRRALGKVLLVERLERRAARQPQALGALAQRAPRLQPQRRQRLLQPLAACPPSASGKLNK